MVFPQVRQASQKAVEEARMWVRSLKAQGGTEMVGALRLALSGQGEDGGRVRHVIFLTDGCVGNEQQLFSFIRERLGRSRLFTVGIGSAPNSRFMERAARFGRGTFTYIGRTTEVEETIRSLFAKLESPVLTDLHVGWGGKKAEMWPKRIPDLYLANPWFWPQDCRRRLQASGSAAGAATRSGEWSCP